MSRISSRAARRCSSSALRAASMRGVSRRASSSRRSARPSARSTASRASPSSEGPARRARRSHRRHQRGQARSTPAGRAARPARSTDFVGSGELLQRADLLAEVANPLAQLAAPVAQPVELAIRFDRLERRRPGCRATSRRTLRASARVADPAARLEQADVDALRQQRAGPVQSGRALGFGGAQTLLQPP